MLQAGLPRFGSLQGKEVSLSPSRQDRPWGPGSFLSNGRTGGEGGGVISVLLKRAGREDDHSPPSSTELKNEWSYTSIPSHVFAVWCLICTRLLSGNSCKLSLSM